MNVCSDRFSKYYHDVIYNFLYKFLKSPELTEDLAQDLFVKLWDKLAELPELLSAKSYLLTMAKHHTFNFLNCSGVDQTAKAEIVRHYPVKGNSLESAVHFNDYKRYRETLLDTLTPQSREVSRLGRQ